MSQGTLNQPLAKSPWRLRFLMAAVVAICCVVLATSESADVYSTDIFGPSVHWVATTHIGWPLPAIDLIRKGSEEAREGGSFRPANVPVTGIELHWRAAVYDMFVIFSLVVATLTCFLPWRDFPQPRFSLADVFVVLTCATIGFVVWYQICVSRVDAEQRKVGWFIAESTAYLIITLAAASALNGLVARGQHWMRPRAAADRGC
jgi:hypothetical protein